MSELVTIAPDITAGELLHHLAKLGADLMVRAVAALSRGVLGPGAAGNPRARVRAETSTRPRPASIGRPAGEVHNHIRGLSPDPGACSEADFGQGPNASARTLIAGRGRRGTGTVREGW
jgi:methionyl-tRNA formyltransferase